MLLLVALVAGAGAQDTRAFEECGDLVNAYGPYDYRTERDKLVIVESYHFTPDVEALRSGKTGTLGGDIDYTLRASPNHSRALIAIANLGRTLNTDRPPGANYTIGCYFDRAIRFAGNDPVVRLIYGTYLSRIGKPQEAVKELEVAVTLDESNANIHYNLGLIYLDLKNYPQAREHARRAYALGFALPGLRKRLEDLRQWDSTADAATPSPAVKSKPAGVK